MDPTSPGFSSETSHPDTRYIRQINGRHFVLFSGLLDLSNRMGLTQLEVEVLVHPSAANENTAVCIATASLSSGMKASDLGEASAATLDPRVAKFVYSMASTRAKARALRNLCGVGMTCMEELGSFSDVIGEPEEGAAAGIVQNEAQNSAPTNSTDSATSTPQAPTNIRQFPSSSQAKANSGSGTTGTNSSPATEAQLRAINSIAKRRKLSAIELANFSKASLGMGLENLTKAGASKLIDALKQAA